MLLLKEKGAHNIMPSPEQFFPLPRTASQLSVCFALPNRSWHSGSW